MDNRPETEGAQTDEEPDALIGLIAQASSLSSSSLNPSTSTTPTIDGKEVVSALEAQEDQDHTASSMLDFQVHVHEEISDENQEPKENDLSPPVAPHEKQNPTPPDGDQPSRNGDRSENVQSLSKKRKRPGKARKVRIDDNVGTDYGLVYPPNQYETTIHRRAVRKYDDGTASLSLLSTENFTEDGLEIYGDTSLGMKLQILAGRVIVQHLNPLSDGRASPAQLSGAIHRGDVLLSIDCTSIVNLSLEQLMLALKPLSTANEDGLYARSLTLRFSSRVGLDLLLKSEEVQSKSAPNAALGSGSDEVVKGVMTLFPMVDQLSGMPIFDEAAPGFIDEAAPKQQPPQDLRSESPSCEATNSGTTGQQQENVSLVDYIARRISHEQVEDKTFFESKYFVWNDKTPAFLRSGDTGLDPESSLTLPEFYARGRRAILGAAVLNEFLEKRDSGKDFRSFHSWSSTMSLYSRASTRRRLILDSSSLPMNLEEVNEENESDNESAMSDGEESKDAEEILVRLAARDDAWRSQVLEYLAENAIDTSSENSVGEEKERPGTFLSNELGNILFGDKMSRILREKKRPKILPPEDATAVLFELVSKLATVVPDEITLSGAHISHRSSLLPFKGIKTRPPNDSDTSLAVQFIVNEALPLWLKTFRPLSWDNRRILWPRDPSGSAKSTASTISADSLTLESESVTSFLSPVSSKKHFKKKDLREKIEEQELDPETKSETCFLVTYYFTQKLLPSINEGDEVKEEKEALVCSFVSDFGSYLKLHTCLAYSAILKARNVLRVLLDVAKFDPCHKDAMRRIANGKELVFYESTILSALLKYLHSAGENSASVNERLVDLCSSAYPDVRPWQVREAFGSTGNNFYYDYLCTLLDPDDGHDRARRDSALVQEWCTLSLTESHDAVENQRRKRKFLLVASATSSDHLVFHRDLPFLVTSSLEAREFALCLDLVSEWIDSPSQFDSQGILDVIRRARVNFVPKRKRKDQVTDSEKLLRRCIRILFRLSQHLSPSENSFSVEEEFVSMRDEYIKQSSHVKALDFFNILRDEVPPRVLLSTLDSVACDNLDPKELASFLKNVLIEGMTAGNHNDLSATLFRIRIRDTTFGVDSNEPRRSEEESVYNMLACGNAPIVK